MTLKEQLSFMNAFREALMKHSALPEESVIQTITEFMKLSELDVRAYLAFIHDYHGQRFESAEEFIGEYDVCGSTWEAEELVNYMNVEREVPISLYEILKSSEFIQLPSGCIRSWNY